MRFRILELLIVIGVFAFGVASLTQPTTIQAVLFPSFALGFFLLAILLAFVSIKRKFFWIGFAVTGLFYIWLTGANRFVDSEFNGQYSHFTNDGFPTSRLLQYGYSQAYCKDNQLPTPYDYVAPTSGVFCIWDDLNDDPVEVVPNGFGGSQNSGGITENDFSSLLDLIKETVGEETFVASESLPYASNAGGIFPAAQMPPQYNATPAQAASKVHPYLHFCYFMHIGHCFFALILAWIGGHSCEWIHTRSIAESVAGKKV